MFPLIYAIKPKNKPKEPRIMINIENEDKRRLQPLLNGRISLTNSRLTNVLEVLFSISSVLNRLMEQAWSGFGLRSHCFLATVFSLVYICDYKSSLNEQQILDNLSSLESA